MATIGDIIAIHEALGGSGGGSGGGGVLVVNVTVTGDFETGLTFTFDKTAGEVWQAGAAIISYEYPEGEFNKKPITSLSYMPNEAEARYMFSDISGAMYTADTASDYPVSYS